MPRGKQDNKEDAWIFHMYHLAGGLIFLKNCWICNLACYSDKSLNVDLRENNTFYREAIKSGRRSLPLEALK